MEYRERDPGTRRVQRRRMSTGHRNRPRAKRRAQEIAGTLAIGGAPVGRDPTLHTLFDIYRREVTPTKGVSKQAHYLRASAMFLRTFGSRSASRGSTVQACIGAHARDYRASATRRVSLAVVRCRLRPRRGAMARRVRQEQRGASHTADGSGTRGGYSGSALRDEYAFWLYISVHNPIPMRVIESLRDFTRELHGSSDWKLPLAEHQLSE